MDPQLAKSTSGSVTNRSPLIAKSDVGGRVLVGGAIRGTLRYVGPVIGKEGIFCGVELETADGKHNGSFQGVAYFQCPPHHGIFAPLYKVELDGSDEAPHRNPLTISQLKRPTQLVKSSIATFRSPAPTAMETSQNPMEQSTASTSGFMDVSMMSTASSNFSNFLDSSLIMNASGVGDDMASSQATYVICRGAREDEIMNVSEPELPIMLSDDSDEDDVITAANFKNGNAIFGESTFEEDDLKTPMAEFYSPPMAATITNDSTSQRSLSEMSVDTGYHGESDGSMLSAGSSFRAEESEKAAKQPITPIKEEVEMPPASTKAPQASAKPPAKPKKERISLLESIQKPVEQPPRVRNPKPPSKHQLMMEQLKASIAADKVKPKKEIKSKLASSIPPPPAQPQQASSANGGEMAPTPEGPDTPKRTQRTLKPVASKTVMPPAPAPALRIPKPRQPLYVAPPPKERPPKKGKEPTVSRTASQASIQSIPTTRSKLAAPVKAKSLFPTSSFAPSTSKPKLSVSSAPKPSKEELEAEVKAKAEATAIALEKVKLERLQKAVAYGDAMVLLYKREEELKRKEAEENVRGGQRIEKLRIEMVEAKEDATLREQRLSKSYEERIHEIQRNHEAEEERWEEETNKIHRQHQLKCAELDGKLADASEQVEKLKKDKQKLEATLAEDENSKIKNLTAEIQSLNTAIEMKSEEMKDMRQKNASLLLRVDEIPCKDQEIQKLRYKVKECLHEISRLRETEKTLTNEYEDLQRSTKRFAAKTEEIAKENDLLRYQMEEQASPFPQSMQASPFSQSMHIDKDPCTPVRFRAMKPGSFSASMSATLPARVTRSTYGELDSDYEEINRSVISMYQSRGRPQSCNVDTIYAPEGTFTGDVFTNGNEEISDSGIGLSNQ